VQRPIRADFSIEEGLEVRAPFRRAGSDAERRRGGADYWNVIEIEWGSHAIVAWRPGELGVAPGVSLEAALNVPEGGGATVPAAIDAVELSRTKGRPPAETRKLVERALASPEDVLRGSAVELLKRRALPREEAVPLLARAFLESRLGVSATISLGLPLAEAAFFLVSGRDDAPNVAIVAALATTIVKESAPDRALMWGRQLSACLSQPFPVAMERPEPVSARLIRGVTSPPPGAVIAAFERHANDCEEEDAEMFRELATRWRAATTASA